MEDDVKIDEKAELQHLNDRLADYIEKVRCLELQNKVLSMKVEEPRFLGGSSHVAEMLEEELTELRLKMEAVTSQHSSMEVEREILMQRLQENVYQNEQAEYDLSVFRENEEIATMAKLDMERRIKSLEKEIDILKKSHEEEIRELQNQMQETQVDQVDSSKLDLTSALRDIRKQYEDITAKNISETEDWYKSKITDLKQAVNKNNDSLRQAKQESMEYRHQIQLYTLETVTIKKRNESLVSQVREMKHEASGFKNTISRLVEDNTKMKDETASRQKQYQDLHNEKITLNKEITRYRKLLEGEESRISDISPPDEGKKEGDDDDYDEDELRRGRRIGAMERMKRLMNI